ncbi:hypothetical protein H9P43_002553 [Blastocladiella emersonii ATCC 22665]|nr:hypothetical protein H9P43_002553 [Blastocladiella emersonii ATCC 22665]
MAHAHRRARAKHGRGSGGAKHGLGSRAGSLASLHGSAGGGSARGGDEQRVRGGSKMGSEAAVTHLSLQAHGIAGFEPSTFDAFLGLKVLYLYDNRVTSVEALAPLRHLERLYLQNNAIASLEPLSGLESLKILDASGNRIAYLADLHLESLEELHLDRQTLEPGDCLRVESETLHFPSLRILTMTEAGLEDPLPLARFNQLEEVSLASNPIHDLEAVAVVLSVCPRVHSLDLSGCPAAAGPRAREKLVLVHPELDILNGREISPVEKAFLFNWQRHRHQGARHRSSPGDEAAAPSSSSGVPSLPPIDGVRPPHVRRYEPGLGSLAGFRGAGLVVTPAAVDGRASSGSGSGSRG